MQGMAAMKKIGGGGVVVGEFIVFVGGIFVRRYRVRRFEGFWELSRDLFFFVVYKKKKKNRWMESVN